MEQNINFTFRHNFLQNYKKYEKKRKTKKVTAHRFNLTYITMYPLRADDVTNIRKHQK